MTKKCLLIVSLLSALSGCTGIPRDAFFLGESSLEDRRLQSREFPTDNEARLLTGGTEILKNMGFVPEKLDVNLGLIIASRNEGGGRILAKVIAAPFIGMTPTDKEVVKATLVTTPSRRSKGAHIMRVTFHRITFNSDGEVNDVELLNDQKLYNIFFERLEMSLFIEANSL